MPICQKLPLHLRLLRILFFFPDRWQEQLYWWGVGYVGDDRMPGGPFIRMVPNTIGKTARWYTRPLWYIGSYILLGVWFVATLPIYGVFRLYEIFRDGRAATND